MKSIVPHACALLLIAAAVTSAAGAAEAPATRSSEPIPIHGTIDAVTVYQGQALVTRVVDIPGPGGVKDIVVGGLPERIQPGSIYAEGEGSVAIRTVSYSVRPVSNDVRADVQKFDVQIRALQDQISANQRKTQVLQAEREYLTKLENFTATTANVEMSKGVLNADTLTKLTQYQFEQRQSISDQEMKLALELRDLNEQLQTAQRSRAQVATSSSKLEREARVLVDLPGNGGKIRLRYIVDAATWLPSYNVRATKKQSDKITVEYLASIQQLSGEDWNNVTMTLSTATPSLVAKAPLLNELAITSSRGGQAPDVLAQLQKEGSEEARKGLEQQRLSLENFRANLGNQFDRNSILNSSPVQSQMNANTVTLNGSIVNLDYIGDNNDVDLFLNKTAGDIQLVDLLAKERIARSKEKLSSFTSDGGVAVTYSLGNNRTSLQSRSDRQLIRISSLDYGAAVYKVAIPILTNAIYDEATATNDKMVLLFGDVNTYMDNEFVGRGVMPSVAIGQRFSVGLGIDSSLRARRELVEKNETPQGGNRVVDFTYRLFVENFGNAPAKVHLLDRLPKANESDIKVTPPVTPKDAKLPWLSDDPAYTEYEAKKGILRWDRDIPARAVDDKAFTLDYSFKLEYAANATITTPAPTATPAGGGGGMGGRGASFPGGRGAANPPRP
jgi:hypothetical protein